MKLLSLRVCYSLRSHKVQEAEMLKMADFSLFSWPACSRKILQLLRGSYSSAHILRLCPCLLFVVVAITQFEMDYHKGFSQCFVLMKTAKKVNELYGYDSKTTVPT